TQRALTEARGGRFQLDAVETIGTDLEKMTREGLFAPFDSPHMADLVPAAIPPHRAWLPDRLSYLGVAYNTMLVQRAERPAPIDGLPCEPVVPRPLGIGLARRAPHPQAALLCADFVLSPEGQALFASLGRPPASRKVKMTLGQFESVMMDPAVELDASAKWEKVWKALFLSR